MPKVLFRPMESDFENVTVIFENIHQQIVPLKCKNFEPKMTSTR